MISLVIIFYIILGACELIPIFKSRDIKKIITYSIFFLAAFIMSIMLSLEKSIPSPLKPVEGVIKYISNR